MNHKENDGVYQTIEAMEAIAQTAGANALVSFHQGLDLIFENECSKVLLNIAKELEKRGGKMPQSWKEKARALDDCETVAAK